MRYLLLLLLVAGCGQPPAAKGPEPKKAEPKGPEPICSYSGGGWKIDVVSAEITGKSVLAIEIHAHNQSMGMSLRYRPMGREGTRIIDANGKVFMMDYRVAERLQERVVTSGTTMLDILTIVSNFHGDLTIEVSERVIGRKFTLKIPRDKIEDKP